VTAAVKVDQAQDRVVVHLARPEVRDAIDQQMVDDLTQAILFETDEKQARMTAFLERKKR
jgi:enoyl-CoA hydratase/carnithine racemase